MSQEENPIIESDISASRIQAWMFCSRSHHFKYVLGLPGTVGPAAKVGIKMHDRIAEALITRDDPKLPSAWLANYKSMIKQLKLSNNLLIEKHLTAKALGHPIQGYLDVLDLDEIFILDWKTGKVRPYPVQAFIYTTLVEELLGEQLPFYYCYLKSNKIHQVTKEDLKKGRKYFESYIARLDDYLPQFDSESNKCKACSYRVPCSLGITKI